VSDRFTVVALEEVEGTATPGQARWHMVRRALGIEAFGVNAWRATEAGQRLIGEHDEMGGGAGQHEELYVVLEGRATFTVDGETVDAPAGTLVFVRDPAARRAAVAEEAGTVVLVVGAKRGEAFVVSGWEDAADALRFWETEEWGRAIELLSQHLAEQPEQAVVAYNLACAESRAGLVDAALEHLERAIELQPSFASTARDDPDFASIRDDPRFPSTK
jgi:tetratricopeptide (TPR) repeat protein